MTASSATTLRSHISANSIPPATACPSMAPITGLVSFNQVGPWTESKNIYILSVCEIPCRPLTSLHCSTPHTFLVFEEIFVPNPQY